MKRFIARMLNALEIGLFLDRAYHRRFMQPEVNRMKAAHFDDAEIAIYLVAATTYASPGELPHERLHRLIDEGITLRQGEKRE